MSLQRVARANVLQHLRLGDASSHQTRVIGVQNQLRRLSLATNSRFSTPLAGSPSAVKSQQSQSFATEATKTDSAKKSTKKSTTKEPKAEKKKTKRVLTEKQKEAKEKKESRELIKQLKETALQPPKKLPQVARSIAIQHKIKELREQSSSMTPVEIFKEAISQVYSQRLNEADRFINQAEENRAANAASYEAWIQLYTPLQVKQANTARKHLRRLGHAKYFSLQDERLVKFPTTAYLWFMKERHERGDLKHLPVGESATRLAGEWKNMTDSEKQPYFEKSDRDVERYREEYREAYGEEVPSPRAKASST
ncbi:uncharacterized protein N7496_006450 [Penicillium cataractarum]|uniref:HMG box domain-containing protein n=1 Tax=Penicillium cataractarum TaxID=2100454 RepID=A0A9W9V656_9EURO|nr:uncharacterized protein N7496_006450 [Penicillium cataractarum]KAJ5370358.1 hypothetical protein N7496_006450 [Penicillium cataractarum]